VEQILEKIAREDALGLFLFSINRIAKKKGEFEMGIAINVTELAGNTSLVRLNCVTKNSMVMVAQPPGELCRFPNVPKMPGN
jgi:hypothetical protein